MASSRSTGAALASIFSMMGIPTRDPMRSDWNAPRRAVSGSGSRQSSSKIGLSALLLQL
jgi:hypothetical protein